MNKFAASLTGLAVSALAACAPPIAAESDDDAIAGQVFLSVVSTTPADADIERAERQAETLIARELDAERARLTPDAPALARDAALNEIARSRSQEMASGAPFSHYDSDGHFVAEDMMAKQFGAKGVFGENILQEELPGNFDAAGFASRAVEGWMSSPGHRRNILYADFHRAGIGVVVRGRSVYATEVFLGPPHPR